MIAYTHRCLIVTAANQALAQQICAQLPPGQSGVGMFVTPCSPSGALPATHYITEGPLDPQFVALMGNANMLYAACQAHVPVVNVTLAQCQSILSQSDVSTDQPFTALTRLGLKLIAKTI